MEVVPTCDAFVMENGECDKPPLIEAACRRLNSMAVEGEGGGNCCTVIGRGRARKGRRIGMKREARREKAREKNFV